MCVCSSCSLILFKFYCIPLKKGCLLHRQVIFAGYTPVSVAQDLGPACMQSSEPHTSLSASTHMLSWFNQQPNTCICRGYQGNHQLTCNATNNISQKICNTICAVACIVIELLVFSTFTVRFPWRKKIIEQYFLHRCLGLHSEQREREGRLIFLTCSCN